MNIIQDKAIEWVELVQIAGQDLFLSLINYLPSLASALVLYIIGRILSRLGRSGVSKMLKVSKFESYAGRSGLEDAFKKGGLSTSASDLIAGFAYWFIMLAFLIPILRVLGLTTVSDMVGDLLTYIPNIVVAILILTAGLILARILRDAVATLVAQVDESFAKLSGVFAQSIIIFFVAVLAANQTGIDTTVITANLSIFIAGFMLTVALSFGFGIRDIVESLVGMYYVKQILKVGDKVTYNGKSFSVKQLTAVSVVLKNGDSRVIVPAKSIVNETTEM